APMRNPRLIFAKERTVTGMEETIVRFWRLSCDCCFPGGPRCKPRNAVANARGGVATTRGNPPVRYLGNLDLCPKLAHFNEQVPMFKRRPANGSPLSQSLALPPLYPPEQHFSRKHGSTSRARGSKSYGQIPARGQKKASLTADA